MKIKTCLAFATIAAVLLTAAPVLAAGGDDILGIWVTPEGRTHVEIYKDGETYSGKIIWLGEPDYPADDDRDMAGKPKVDRENPDQKLRDQPLVGLQLLRNLQASGSSWKNGSIYDPKEGKTYKCKASLKGDTLHLRGYIGFSLIGRTSLWTRLQEDG